MTPATSAHAVPAWTNWAGTERAAPSLVESPQTAAEVAAAITRAREAGSTVKMMGSGHSFTGISAPEGTMLQADQMRGVLAFDETAMTVTAAAGTHLKTLNLTLEQMGLSLHNMGDIAEQTLAGAVSTGTHGSGGTVAGLAAQLAGFQLVTGTGEVLNATASENPEVFALARVGLGALGILTQVTFKVEPAFLLQAEERPMSWAELIGDFEALTRENHHVDAHWFPHTDAVLYKANNRLAADLADAEPLAAWKAWVDDKFLSNTVFGWTNHAINRFPSTAPHINALAGRALSARSYSDVAHRVFVSTRTVRFKEMEYALPREASMAALQEVRALIDASPWRIGFPVEVRTAPADDVALSTAYGRETTYLAFHVHHQADHTDYFREVEAVMRAHDGRPHWAKMNTRTREDLAPTYPRFEEFVALRDRLDPDRVFANTYLRRVLGD